MLHHILPDIPRFYTALAEWLACLVCICGTKRRLTGWKFAGASVVILGIQSVFFVLTKEMCGILWLLCMAIAVGVMYFYIMISSEMNWKDGVYYCTGAFVAAETVASLEWQIDCFFSFELQWSSEWMKNILARFDLWFILFCDVVGIQRIPERSGCSSCDEP